MKNRLKTLSNLGWSTFRSGTMQIMSSKGSAELHWSDDATVYHPRKPKESPLWNLLNDHFDNFKRNYSEWFEKEYGFFRLVISEVVRDFLKCGDLKGS